MVDNTIGLNDKTFVDNYRTPHSEQLHVTERWKLVDNSNMLEVGIRVEDPGTYYEPWSAIQRFRRVRQKRCVKKPAPRTTSIYSTTASR